LGKKRIGLVGLGLMGSDIARNLIASGWDLFAYDIDHRRSEQSSHGVEELWKTLRCAPNR